MPGRKRKPTKLRVVYGDVVRREHLPQDLSNRELRKALLDRVMQGIAANLPEDQKPLSACGLGGQAPSPSGTEAAS